MSAKKKLLGLANSLIAPTGVQLYRKGVDMESVLRQIAGWDHGINSVIDMGAAKGDWSRMALKLFPNARFVGVDPLDERKPFLDKLKAENPRFDYVQASRARTTGAR